MEAHQGDNQSSQFPLRKVVILGDKGVGKSCLINQFVNNRFDTKEVKISKKDLEYNGINYTLQISNTTGQESIENSSFLVDTDICLLTYSIDNLPSFEYLKQWHRSYMVDKGVAAFPFLVVGNKVDVPKDRRKVLEEDAKQWCSLNGMPPPVETSAMDATRVKETFFHAVKIWAQHREKIEKRGNNL